MVQDDDHVVKDDDHVVQDDEHVVKDDDHVVQDDDHVVQDGDCSNLRGCSESVLSAQPRLPVVGHTG